MTRSSTTASMACASGAVSAAIAASPLSTTTRLIAAFLHHVFDQAALHRIVVGNQNGGSHGFPRTLQLSVSNRGTLADAD